MRALVCMVSLTLLAEAAKPRWHELEGYSFEQYVLDFKKHYVPTEDRFAHRREIFNKNLEHIRRINSDETLLWRAGVNMFTDMTPAEFKRLNGLRIAHDVRKQHTIMHDSSHEPLPQQVDWRSATTPRVLTAVKHQGSCGSCWAHSAAESVEAQYALLTGMLPVLSVAQINSCTPSNPPYNCQGCGGGDYTSAWAFLADQAVNRPEILKSVTENWAYPIPLSDWFFSDQSSNYSTSPCRDVSQEWKQPATSWFAELSAAGVSGFGVVNSNSALGGAALMKTLRDVGPLSVSVAAGNWQWYESGIFHNTNSSGPDMEWNIDHAVQMVGYGYDKVLDANYWTVRNSWSTLWGEDGFIRLFRAKNGEPEQCSPASYGPVCGTSGVLSFPAYPIVYQATPTKFG